MNPPGQFTDTIYALGSGGLPSGLAVIRVSGPGAHEAVRILAGSVPEPRTASLKTIRGRNNVVLDRGLVLCFAAPRSFTGEDCAELHLHGGPAVVRAVLTELAGLEGLRHAEAGEFTRRAFLNGKLDLTQAEGLADLISAQTEAERRLAIATSGGAQEELYTGWRARLLRARALIEADLDFADESDVPGSVAGEVWRDMAALASEIETHLSRFRMAEIVRDGYQVVILGRPNVGKSSLLNAIAGREAAIVTDVPGTTRDVLRVDIELSGNRVAFSDTAGIRDSDDKVERIGIEKARDAAKQADLVLYLYDSTSEWPVAEALETREGRPERLVVATKVDLLDDRSGTVPADARISVRDGRGLDELLTRIGRMADKATAFGDMVIPTRQRHMDILRDCVAHLRRGKDIGSTELELGAEELRQAAHILGRLTGGTDVEEILGAIFSTFCIGK